MFSTASLPAKHEELVEAELCAELVQEAKGLAAQADSCANVANPKTQGQLGKDQVMVDAKLIAFEEWRQCPPGMRTGKKLLCFCQLQSPLKGPCANGLNV